MRPRSRHLATLAAAAAVLLPAGCGSSEDPKGEPLPAEAVAELTRRLDEVQRRFDDGTKEGNAGACKDIETDSYKGIDATVANLPQDVDDDVRTALEESLARLRELTRDGCSGVEDTHTEPEPTPPPQTIPQETIPQQTEKQPKKDEEPKQKKQDEGADGGTPTPDAGTGGQTVPLPPEN
ncbi:MAG: hypothetical protein ACR2FZ_00465 [Thermoleophilaceae bacterium]